MRKQRMEVARDVHEKLHAAELKIDEAITAISTLQAAIPHARQQIRIAASIGHGAMESGSATLSSLVTARAHILAMHEQLDDAKTHIGLRHMASGTGFPKEPAAQLELVKAG